MAERFIAGHFVLVVDDTPTIRAATAALLSTCCPGGVVAFGSSVRALEYCRTHAPAVAVLDVGMPELDGVALAHRLRALYPALPIVFHTGSPRALEDAEPLDPPAALVAKPCRGSDLVAVVEAATQTRA